MCENRKDVKIAPVILRCLVIERGVHFGWSRVTWSEKGKKGEQGEHENVSYNPEDYQRSSVVAMLQAHRHANRRTEHICMAMQSGKGIMKATDFDGHLKGSSYWLLERTAFQSRTNERTRGERAPQSCCDYNLAMKHEL